MANSTDDNLPDNGSNPIDLQTENEILKLKLMAELGSRFAHTSDGLPPELENQFLQQVYAFEKNFASGESISFEASVGRPSLPPLAQFVQLPEPGQENLVLEALDFYREKNVDIHFQFDYPATTRYQFLLEELGTHPNHFGQIPGMMVGVIYEDYHPNHGKSIELGTESFMEALRELSAENMKISLSPVQFLPEGPYPTQVLLDKLSEKFEAIDSLGDFEWSLLETSYELSTESGGEEPASEVMGMGYAEGLIRFVVNKKNGEKRPISGPFKFYFQYEYGVWSIIYMVFPGIKYPPLPEDAKGPANEN